MQAQKLATLGELVATIGHELNNPISSLKLSLASERDTMGELNEFLDSLFEGEEGTDEARAVLADLRERFEQDEEAQMLCANRIATISEALRKASRVDGVAIPFDINDIVDNSITLTQGKLKRVKIQTELGIFDEIVCRPSHLGQVFTNLLSNAADALTESSARQGTIHISTQRLERASIDGVSIIIEDSGPGVPDELKEKILKPFFTTKAAGIGTGLGLPICARIIAAHEGDLAIGRSPELGGARFEVWLPNSPASLN